MYESLLSWMEQHYLILRMISCFIVGYWWCASGTLLQWSTQNSLACPVTLGLTALPISVWLTAYLIGINPENLITMLGLIIFLILLHLILYKIIQIGQQDSIFSNSQFIMIGVGLNLSLAAIYSFFHFFYSAQGLVLPNSLWFGLLKNMDSVRFGILIFTSFFFLSRLNNFLPQLSLLSLGRSFGQNVCKVSLIEKKMLFFVSLLLSILVITGGVFAFWGLVLPHLVRKISYFRGSLVKEVYLGSSFAGLLMMIADFLCYNYPVAGSELPVGILSSVLGPILLVCLIYKKNKNLA